MGKHLGSWRWGVLALLVGLAACSGRESTSVTPPSVTKGPEPPATTPSSVDIGGSASLGVIAFATVTVTLASDNSELATTTTTASGDYTVNLPANVGPVLVEISPAGNGQSTYLCDYPGGCPAPSNGGAKVDFGQTVPYTSTLSAAVVDSSQASGLNVNPFTTAVVKRAIQLGGLTVANTNQANQ